MSPPRVPLVAGQWSKVVLTAAAGRVSASVNGKEVLVHAPGDAPDEAAHLSRMYALQRYITACAGRGALPHQVQRLHLHRAARG
jgi:hypothetical protein